MKRSMLSLSLCLSLAPLAVGCGPAGQQFHGEYSGSSTHTLILNGLGSNTQSAPMTFRIYEGVDSDIILFNPHNSCAIPADVDKDVATLKAGTACTGILNGITATNTITSGTAVLTGKVVQLSISSTVSVSSEGQSYPGSFVQNVSLTRIGK